MQINPTAALLSGDLQTKLRRRMIGVGPRTATCGGAFCPESPATSAPGSLRHVPGQVYYSAMSMHHTASRPNGSRGLVQNPEELQAGLVRWSGCLAALPLSLCLSLQSPPRLARLPVEISSCRNDRGCSAGRVWRRLRGQKAQRGRRSPEHGRPAAAVVTRRWARTSRAATGRINKYKRRDTQPSNGP